MRGHELLASLRDDFAVTGTAGQPVYVRDAKNGLASVVLRTEREVHEDGTITHWLVTEEC